MARHATAAGVDVIPVGDSVGNTTLGLPGTWPVTLDMMLHHTAAVARATRPASPPAAYPSGATSASYPNT